MAESPVVDWIGLIEAAGAQGSVVKGVIQLANFSRYLFGVHGGTKAPRVHCARVNVSPRVNEDSFDIIG